MKKYFALLTLLSLSLVVVTSIRAQTRPRRVGGDSNRVQPPATTPSRPPVLGGANYPNNRQPAKQPEPELTGPEELDAGDIVRVNTTLVTIPVSVMDRDGRYVPNLRKEDFRIWEDGVEQDVAFFNSVDKPFSVVLMLDTSPSTQFRQDDIHYAAVSFINQLRPDDKVMVVSFSDEIKILSEFTSDRQKLERAVSRARTGNGTRLYDAVDMVMNRELNRIQGRKAIVLFTDGVDTTSRRATFQSNLLDAQELDALIYAVQYDTSADIGGTGTTLPGSPSDILGQILGGIFGGGRRGNNRGGGGGGGYPPSGPSGVPDDYRLGDQYLRELSNNTGGRQYRADTVQNMSSAFANVAEELRRQYSVGFYPKRTPQPGQRRQIKVRANQPNLAVRARDSYIFNPSGTAVADDNTNRQPVLRKLAGQNRAATRF